MVEYTWEDKAHRLISAMCLTAYQKANPKPLYGKKKAKPYQVPALAQTLVECLNTNNEEKAKAIFLTYNLIADEYKR